MPTLTKAFVTKSPKFNKSEKCPLGYIFSKSVLHYFTYLTNTTIHIYIIILLETVFPCILLCIHVKT
jgi:hypothetical protein